LQSRLSLSGKALVKYYSRRLEKGKRMLAGKKIMVVMPAYNAAQTLERTFQDIPFDVVDEVLLVDDASHDETLAVARRLGICCFLHERNLGYGRNQKTCYTEALKSGADIIVMVHPDYQYSPKIIPALAGLVASGEYEVAIGSRILGGQTRKGGMPLYKYLANRFLTFFENLLLRAKLSEYHTGFRAYSRRVLETLPLWENSDDFVFDNEILAQVIYFGFPVGEVSCPTRYFPEASSINFPRSVKYGLGVLATSMKFVLQKLGLAQFRIFSPSGRGLGPPGEYYSRHPDRVP
jgi:glycosyltransferase involved in cell wall biosynthesis